MPTMPATFRAPHAPTPQERVRENDRARGSSRERGYDHKWDQASKRHIKANPLCLGCEAIGKTTAAVLTDHRIPHKGNRVLFWDRGNRQSSCKWHHDVIKQKLERMHAAGAIGTADLHLDSDIAKKLTLELMK